MTVGTEPTTTGAVLPGPGGFATTLPMPILTSTATTPTTSITPTLPVPRRSAGLQLHGEYQGSGFTEPRYIARRGDGQVVQLSRLLYLVADAVDGTADAEQISHRVSARFGRDVSGDNVVYLVEQKLTPLGVTVPWDQLDDAVADAPRSDLLLALKGHKVLFPPRRVEGIARALSWLHRPPVVALVLAGAVAMDVWLFGFFGAMTPVLEVLNQPVLLLAVFGLTVASLVFHEFGHASACRYGGAHPGCIGCGLFLIWPSMYTDVTDVYRIGRAGRVRTDLGGVYFNVVFMLGMCGCYFLTGQQFFLSAVYLGHFEVLEQLMPAVRLDGYYILGDLAGVPDLYGKIRPILLSMVPGRPTPPEAAGLKRSARVTVTVWVLTMVPLLLGDLGYALWNLPRLLATGLRSLDAQLTGTGEAFWHGQLAAGLVGLLGSAMLVFPLAGTAYLSVRLAGRLLRTAGRATHGRPVLRLTLTAVGVATVSALACAWLGGLTPKPLPAQPPIVPVLQPGVPTTEPSTGTTAPARARPSAPAPGRGSGALPGGASSSPSSLPGPGPGTSPSASPDAAPSASGTAAAPGASASAAHPSAPAHHNPPTPSAGSGGAPSTSPAPPSTSPSPAPSTSPAPPSTSPTPDPSPPPSGASTPADPAPQGTSS